MTDQHLDSDDECVRWSRPPRTTPAVIDRRVLPNGVVEEWERAATIPDDFIYDPETHGYYAPGEPSNWDAEASRRAFEEELKNLSEEERRKGTFSADELRAAGAFDVPDSWRKSLGNKKPSRQKELFGDDWQDEPEQDEAELDSDDDSSADEDLSADDDE